VKCVHDTLLWVKIEDVFDSDLYICFSYIPHENNVFYSHYESDIFGCLENDISHFFSVGNVLKAGDLITLIMM
jgi:hypothetical protein